MGLFKVKKVTPCAQANVLKSIPDDIKRRATAVPLSAELWLSGAIGNRDDDDDDDGVGSKFTL